MSFLSHGRLSTSLQRYIQVDVDDIFVGQKGTRLTPSDVEVCETILEIFIILTIDGF